MASELTMPLVLRVFFSVLFLICLVGMNADLFPADGLGNWCALAVMNLVLIGMLVVVWKM